MAIKASQEKEREDFGRAVEVSAPIDRVESGLKRFKERMERDRQVQAPRYSSPSEKTRFRVLES